MSFVYNIDNLLPADIHCSRSDTVFGKTIRAVLGSYTNHNGLYLKNKSGRWVVGEAIQPRSTLTPIESYEDGDNVVRVLRIKGATIEERQAIADYFYDNMLGIKYPLSVARLWVFRFVNNLPWKVEGEWCTRIVWDAARAVVPSAFNHPQGKKKKNPTPRTIENRLVAGVVEDVTDSVVENVSPRL